VCADAITAHGDTIIVDVWRRPRWTTAVVRDRSVNLHVLTARLTAAPDQHVLRARVMSAAAVRAGAELTVRDGDVAALVHVDHTVTAVRCLLYERCWLELAAVDVDLLRARVRKRRARLGEVLSGVDSSQQ
jgi:hypothetical protein